jgi:hypothetical protein
MGVVAHLELEDRGFVLAKDYRAPIADVSSIELCLT